LRLRRRSKGNAADMSARVMRTLAEHTPDLEIYSIDEAFLAMGGFGDRLEAHARTLRHTVQQDTGTPGFNRYRCHQDPCQVANRRAKKDPAVDGVFVMLDEASIDAQLATLELTDLWGVAGRPAARLSDIGIAARSCLSASVLASCWSAWCMSLTALAGAEPQRCALLIIVA
jgi:nucleotidyltransferase/DNA polymerase involved in DNA repair